MNWSRFNTYNEAPSKAFEAMCNQLFELWCKREYKDKFKSFAVVNGAGGDGGVEAYTTLDNGEIIAVQSKWFPDKIELSQINQIKKSIETALFVRTNISRYIVCIPRDLSSIKKGKDGKIIKNSEDSKWIKLEEEMKSKYPNLKIELWTESRINSELQEESSSGIYRYWFEKSEISMESIKFSYKKQESGWLSQRYIPSIHSKGIINNAILKFVGNKKNREDILNNILEINLLFERVIKEIDDYLDISKNDDLFSELNRLKEKLIKSNQILIECIELYKVDSNILDLFKSIDIFGNIDYRAILDSLGKVYWRDSIYYHASGLLKDIKFISNLNLIKIQNDIKDQFDYNKLIIVGNPGTGKTHGIADKVSNILSEDKHIAILIQAKSVRAYDSWRDIIVNALGLSSDWCEKELWRALESLSYRKEVNRFSQENNVNIKPKVLICIDGIDESYPHDVWINRIREIDAITNEHPRIKFCITSRPQVFENKLKCNDKLIKLPFDGDCAVSELFDDYIKYYNIKLNNCSWIKWAIKTPLALKLFCQQYEGIDIDKKSKVNTTITKLLKSKFSQIESEFRYITKNKYSEGEHIVLAIMQLLSNYFIGVDKIERKNLLKHIKEHEVLNIISEEDIDILIGCLNNYGILYSYEIDSNDIFSTPTTHYYLGINSFFDYMLALNIIRGNKYVEGIIIPDSLISNEGALKMLSILLLEDYEILVYDIESVMEQLGNYKGLNLSYFSLVNSSITSSTRYIEFIKSRLSIDKNELIDCVMKVILPLSRVENHPLSAQILHNYLIEFKNVAERDKLWSLPDRLRDRDYSDWLNLDNGDVTDVNYKLTNIDMFTGIPLIYAWSLTSLDNHKRSYCRKELAKWAINNPVEFYKLLSITYCTNDPQMKVDLMSITMSVVFSTKTNSREIKIYSKWVLNNIFNNGNIVTYDIAIRYYSRAIVEYAFEKNLISKEELLISRPPYKVNDKLLGLNKDALGGTRMGGYGPINYDLSRYVLCDPIIGLFFGKNYEYDVESYDDYDRHFKIEEIEQYLTNNDLSEECKLILSKTLEKKKETDNYINKFDIFRTMEIEKLDEKLEDKEYIENQIDEDIEEINELLEAHAKSIDEHLISEEAFIISSAFKYIQELGWDRDRGSNRNSAEYVDSKILSWYHAATHGQQSEIMTLAEKYIWCAKDTILGYLADRIIFKRGNGKVLVKDYGLLDDFKNPGQELHEDYLRCEYKINKQYVPENLSPMIKLGDKGREEIIKWINNEDIPNFNDCLNVSELLKGEYIALYAQYSISEVYKYAESIMWVSSAVIDEDEFKLLLKDIDNRQEYIINKLSNPIDIKSYTECSCYITPQEICCMNWKEELEECIYNSTIYNREIRRYKMINAVESCISNYIEHGDVSYRLPSKYMRNILGIINCEGNEYLNQSNEVIAKYYEAGDGWEDYTSIMAVDKNKLFESLKRDKKKLVWSIRLLREATNKSIEKYDKLYDRMDRSWIVWYENNQIKYKNLTQSK